MSETTPPVLEELLRVLDLEPLGSARMGITDTSGLRETVPPGTLQEEVSVFVGQSQLMPHGRVYGGQVLAQVVMASGLTVTPREGGPERPIHSLHAYFMRPGDDKAPIHFAVEHMRDGRSFSTRRVHAVQHGKPILSASASFQEVEQDAPEHQVPMPDVPPPGEVRSVKEVYEGVDDPRAFYIAHGRPIEQRFVGGDLHVTPLPDRTPAIDVWFKTVGALPDDPLLHASVLAYASDYSLLHPTLRAHGIPMATPGLKIASLDHAMWFHRPARADQWLLYAQSAPSSQSGRGLGLGRIYDESGRLVATTAQEGMVRIPG